MILNSFIRRDHLVLRLLLVMGFTGAGNPQSRSVSTLSAAVVTLSPLASPSTTQPGTILVNLTGSGFPSGTISPANVTVTLGPAVAGSGPTLSVVASAVTTIVGTTRRVTFQVPPSPSLAPNVAAAGSTLTVKITAASANLVQGSTTANFGAGVSVGGAPEGVSGPVNVLSGTTATAQLVVDPAASAGARSVTLQVSSQSVPLVDKFVVTTSSTSPLVAPGISVAAPMAYLASITGKSATGATFTSSNQAKLTIEPDANVVSIVPASGSAGQSLTTTLTTQYTNFVQGATKAGFGAGISVGGASSGTLGPVTVTSPTSATAQLTIDPAAVSGPRTVSVATGVQQAGLINGFSVIAPALISVNPNSGQQGQQNLQVAVTGQNTHFVQATSSVTFGAGITVVSLTVLSLTSATAVLNIASAAATGGRTVSVQTGSEQASLVNGFTVQAMLQGLGISDFNPKSGPFGTLVTVTGNNFVPFAGAVPQLTLNKQGGGGIAPPLSSFMNTSLAFVIPAGAATGPLTVSVNGQSAMSAVPLMIVPSSNFTLAAVPGTANLIQGQSVAYAITLNSTNGFTQLAALGVSGVPAGITAALAPTQITAGQTSILTLTAPAAQPIGMATLSVSASTSVNGFPVSASASVMLTMQAPTTSFIGRTVVSNSVQTPIAGVTVTMLGLDGNGNTTGCTGSTASDAAGNFALVNLSAMCVGPQLVGFNGTTATAPPGQYAGVNLVFTLTSGQVTASPVLVHLPQINNVETFNVQQNASTDQNYSYRSIPGLAVTVYAGTTFTLQDGTTPNPFPLAAVQVPVDRLPDAKPNVPTMLRVFIVAFQPANATTNQPVAVYFPNVINSPPGEDMPLMTLDPTHGQMVPYGTGTVSPDGTEIVPDPDPSHPGHLFGLMHFDWHGPMPMPPPQPDPSPPDSGGGGDGPPDGGSPPGGPPNSPTSPGPVQTQPCDPNDCQCQSGSGDTTALITTSSTTAGDPIDLSSGIQTVKAVDISVPGLRGGLALVRVYRSLTTVTGPFGVGASHNYNYGLDTASPGFTSSINLIMPDGNRFPFFVGVACPQIAGANCAPGRNTTAPALQGAVMTVNSDNTVDLRWKNGTVWRFVPISRQVGSLLASISDPNGNTTQITRDLSGKVTSVTDPVGRSLNFAYDSSNRITSIADFVGRSVQYSYNSQGSLASVTDPAGGVTKYAYDANNNMLSLTDPRGVVQFQNTLDSQGRVIQQVRPDGGILTFTYTFANPLAVSPALQAQVSDGLGVQATYRFNINGLLTDITSTDGTTRHIDRVPGTNLRSGVVVASATVTYTYDANGDILTSTDPTGRTTTFTYDSVFNKVTSIADPAGNITSFTYDTHGNLLTTKDADGNTSSSQYDSTGSMVQTTDAMTQTTKFTYDALGNLASVTDPLGNTTSYAYDAISRVVTTADTLGRRTTFTYDPMGRLLSRTDAKNEVTTLTYDPNGNLLSVKDANGNATRFTYDVMNRLATRTNPLGNADTRTYDTDGNLVKFVDRRGQTATFTYDNLNRLTAETYSDATVTHTYDFLGRLAQVNDSASGLFTFSLDLAGRLFNSGTPNGTVNYTYDARGAMASRQVVGQAALSYAYDPAGNLMSAAMPPASATFAYNPRNQLSSMSRLNGVTSAFAYDPDARLISLMHAKGAAAIDAESYTYDSVGNRNSHATSIGQALATQPTANLYNMANQLTQFGSVPDSYDANGNLVQEGAATAYTWDARNRLKSIMTATGQTTNFTYDFTGNLIAQADSGTALNLTKYFVLDDLTNVAFETASDGTSYSVLSGRSIDSHLAIVQSNGQVQYGLPDGLNSTVATVDQTGAVKSQFLYDTYGLTSTTSTFPFQFTGRVPVNTNLYYYRARFYNANTGRFISEDPLGVDTNLYRYALNRPTFLADPTGLQAGSGDFNVTPSGPTAVNGYYQPAVPTAPSYFPYGDYYNQQLISWATNKIIGDLLGELPAGGLLEKLFGNLTPYEYILPPAPTLSGVACSIGPGTPTIIRGANPYQFQVNNSNGTFNGSFIP